MLRIVAALMRYLTGRILLLIVALTFASAVALEAAPDRYAALAFSKSTGRWGYGNGYATKEAAINRALLECGRRDAVTKWAKNAWIALAVSDRKPGGYGWAWATTAARARARARQECIAHNGDGRVVFAVSAFR